jgi:hypothetical protein
VAFQSRERREEQAVGALACMVGGLILARALGERESTQLLEACRGFLRRALGEGADGFECDAADRTARQGPQGTVLVAGDVTDCPPGDPPTPHAGTAATSTPGQPGAQALPLRSELARRVARGEVLRIDHASGCGAEPAP